MKQAEERIAILDLPLVYLGEEVTFDAFSDGKLKRVWKSLL